MLLRTLLTVLSSVSLSVTVNPLDKNTCNWPQQVFLDQSSHSLPSSPDSLYFELRHLHAVSPSARVVFSDVSTTGNGGMNHLTHSTPYAVGTRSVNSYRPPESFFPLFYAANRRARRRQSATHEESSLWKVKKVPGPDVESRETLLHLAKMSNNAYVLPEDGGWYDLGDDWEPVSSL
jgi:lipase ATG15